MSESLQALRKTSASSKRSMAFQSLQRPRARSSDASTSLGAVPRVPALTVWICPQRAEQLLSCSVNLLASCVHWNEWGQLTRLFSKTLQPSPYQDNIPEPRLRELSICLTVHEVFPFPTSTSKRAYAKASPPSGAPSHSMPRLCTSSTSSSHPPSHTQRMEPAP